MPQVEQKVTGVEEAKAETQAEETKKAKKGLKINLIIILVLQLFLAAGGYYVVTKFIKPDPAFKEAIDTKKTDEKKEALKKDAKKQIYPIEDIIVNPAGTGGSRYLSVSVGVEMDAAEEAGKKEGEAKATPLDEKKPQLRDALINVLSAKTIDQLTTPEQKEAIRKEILDTFGKILSPKMVYQIYFIDFVLQ